jgi:nicotinamide riboside kinase
MIVLNLMAEPGAGKSVTAAGAFYQFSINNFKAEVIPEVAKGYAWETPKDIHGKALTHPIFGQQIFLLGEQNRMLERVIGQREIAIMECPLIMTAIYSPDDYFPSFIPLVLEQFNFYKNVNIVLERGHDFDPQGRIHDEGQSKEVKTKLINFLDNNNIPYVKMKTHDDIDKQIVKYVRDKYFPNKLLKSCYGAI